MTTTTPSAWPTIAARVPTELRARVAAEAARRETDLSTIMREALEAHLARAAGAYRGQDFDGATYNRPADAARLGKQLDRVRDLLLDGRPRTLRQIAAELDIPEASASARIRDLRKAKFGAYPVVAQRLTAGTWAYSIPQAA